MDVSRQKCTFAIDFKTIEHETFNNITDSLGGATFLSPSHLRADPYTLSYSLVDPNRLGKPVSRLPKLPLVIDLVGHTLTLPTQVVGNTLTLENEEGNVYTYYIIDTTFQIPEEQSGEYMITISDGNSMYRGTIEL